MQRKQVFISYSGRDGPDFAQELRAKLAQLSLTVWLDEYDIRHDVDLNSDIRQAIWQCDFLLFVMTEKSIRSEECRKEWAFALNCDKTVFTLRFHETIQHSDLPERLQDLSWIDFTTDFEAGMATLEHEIERLKTRPKPDPELFQYLDEFESLFSTGDYLGAYQLLIEERGTAPHRYTVGSKLFRKGDYKTLIDLHLRLNGKLSSGDRKHTLSQSDVEIGNLRQLGSAYRWKGEIDQGIAYLEQARLQAAEATHRSKKAEGTIWSDLGAIYLVEGYLDKAIAYHDQGLRLAEEIGDYAGQALNLRELGPCYEDQGRIREAIEFGEKALRVIAEHGVKGHQGGVHLNLGNYYIRLGEYDRAVTEYEKSAAWYSHRDGRQSRGWCLVQYRLSYAELRMADAAAARERCLNVINSLDAMELSSAQNEVRYFLALACLTLGELNEARTRIEEAKLYNHRRFIQNIEAVRGIIALRQGDRGTARRAFSETRRVADAKLEKCPTVLDAFDMKGIALAGLVLCGEESFIPAAVEAFTQARLLNCDRGTLDGISSLFNLMDSDPKLDSVRAVATRCP